MKLTDLLPQTKGVDARLATKLAKNTIRGLIEDVDIPEVRDPIVMDISHLKAVLASHQIQLGKLVGVGNIALVFEVVSTKTKKPIDSAVIRIDPAGMGVALETPGLITKIFKVRNETFEATIVPAGKERLDYTARDVSKTFAAFNADGHLDRLKDLNNPIPDQFMELPGIDIPVLVDMNSISPERTEAQKQAIAASRAAGEPEKWMGNVATFVEKYANELRLDEIEKTKASPADMEKLRAQRQTLIDKVTKDLVEAEIRLDSPSLTLESPVATLVGSRSLHGQAI